eukprot:sb/3474582/
MFFLFLLYLLPIVQGSYYNSGGDLQQHHNQLPSYDSRIPRQPGCYCLRTSLHNHMCQSDVDFVIKAKILTSRVNPGETKALRGFQVSNVVCVISLSLYLSLSHLSLSLSLSLPLSLSLSSLSLSPIFLRSISLSQ